MGAFRDTAQTMKCMDKETARYIINYFGRFLTEHESKAILHTNSLDKLDGDVESSRAKLYRERGWLSSDPEVMELLRDGYDAFELRTAKRMLADHEREVFLNHCPKCGLLARTPDAKQCRCGNSWREN